MNIDMLVDEILDSYNKFGLINRSNTENFPNRQNVVSVLQDLQSLIFPGFKYVPMISVLSLCFLLLYHNLIICTRLIQSSFRLKCCCLRQHYK